MQAAKEYIKIYPLDRPGDGERMEFINGTGLSLNTPQAPADTKESLDDLRLMPSPPIAAPVFRCLIANAGGLNKGYGDDEAIALRAGRC